MVCRPIGGCLIVALRHDRGGTPIGAADPCRTSCPGCRGSYREGFSHWCRSRSFDGPRPNGSQTELLHSAWAPVSAPGSALGVLLSRALSSAQAAPHWSRRAFTQSFAPRDRLFPDGLAPPATGVTYPSASHMPRSPSTPFRSLSSLWGERERTPQAVSPDAASPRPCGATGPSAPATRAPRQDARS